MRCDACGLVKNDSMECAVKRRIKRWYLLSRRPVTCGRTHSLACTLLVLLHGWAWRRERRRAKELRQNAEPDVVIMLVGNKVRW